jgi:hypothetical protein
MNRLKGVQVQAEDIFRESAYLLDFLMTADDVNQHKVDGLWTLLVNDIRKWKPDADDKDKMLVAGAVFMIVRAVLCQHYNIRYCESISDMLTYTLERELKNADKEEEQQFLDRLRECSTSLCEWINHYEEEEWLSEKIETCLRKRTIKKEQPSGIIGKRDYSQYSFTLICPRKYKGKEKLLLEWLHNELIDKHFIEDFKDVNLGENLEHIVDIDEKNKIIFNEVFSGADTNHHIVWVKDKVELRYFINQLVERKAITWKKGPRKWQIVRNRIWYRKKDYETSDATGRRHPKYTYVQFGEHDFDKGNKPADTTTLDKILDVVAPPTKNMQKQDLGAEIKEDFDEYGTRELTTPNSRGSKIRSGYRDTSHKANNGD